MGEEVEVIEEEKDDQEQKGYLSSFTGYLGGSKQPKKEKPKEEAKKQETMIAKAQTRHQKEEQAMRDRQDSFNHIKEQVQQAQEMQKFVFDRQNLPPVILEQIPYKMRANETQDSARVIMETRVIQNLIQSYFDLTKKNIADLVPKTIMAFLVNESRNVAQSELVE